MDNSTKIDPLGFREYDARWLYPEKINGEGIKSVGKGFGSQIIKKIQNPRVAVGHDYRSYSEEVKNNFIDGLISTGCNVEDIGGYYKELYRHALNYEITFKDIFIELKNNSSKYPLFSEALDDIINKIQKFYFDDENALRKKLEEEIKLNGSPENLDISRDYQLATGKIISSEHRRKYIDEFSKVIINIHLSRAGTAGNEFCKIVENLKDYTEAAIISPQELPEERLEHTSQYDIAKWLDAECSQPLSSYKLKSEKKFILKVRNYNEHQMLEEVGKKWTARNKNLFYFRQVVSSNHRRFIEKLPERSPLPISKDDLSTSTVSSA